MGGLNSDKTMSVPKVTELETKRALKIEKEAEQLTDQCFFLGTGRVVFGMVIKEDKDSFHVGVASLLVKEDEKGDIHGKLITSSPIVRIFKNGLSIVSNLEPDHKYYYYKYALKMASMLPSYFTKARKEKMQEYISKWEKSDSKTTKVGDERPATGFSSNTTTNTESEYEEDRFLSTYGSSHKKTTIH